ncbi:aspartate aminotransferase family protein [Xanthovirga aplysinae]|uniref:aspartate aminotransferase family protein n=1 Tax=Xanthovirga aplysinae TaxID=2529853 RepID=UPI0012BD0664|nr:aspartate aminotransferase family protein [Xanthovirga aplysinae]MTI32772.1 aspartate aminotransferase family protein [Xanthovirga aplysinae]
MQQKEYFLNHQAQTSPFPLGLEIHHAKGIYLYDKQGKAYMDLISGIAVSNLGHSHPKVVSSIKDQLDRYMHIMVYGEFIQDPTVKLAKKLSNLLPDPINSIYFVNSGTEANEGALKLAKRITGKPEIVSCYKSYHGSTHGSLSVSGNETKKNAFRPLLPGVRFMRFNNEQDLKLITDKTAAVIVETIQGDAGIRIPASSYLKKLRQRCDETGAQLILDEVQTGFGRTGTLFAFEHYGIVPDILTMAKGMGGGMPLGAFAASKEKMDLLTHNPMLGHITTFGGHPVCCASALANLEVLIEEKIIEKVEEKGNLFHQLLKDHPLVKEVRYKGLLFAIELETAEIVNQVVQNCLEDGLISFWFLSTPNAFRIAPPLTISNGEIKKACKIIVKAMDKVNGE